MTWLSLYVPFLSAILILSPTFTPPGKATITVVVAGVVVFSPGVRILLLSPSSLKIILLAPIIGIGLSIIKSLVAGADFSVSRVTSTLTFRVVSLVTGTSKLI